MTMDAEQLLRLQVNQPTWDPAAFLRAPKRWFQRPDGYVFPLPATEDWHCARALIQGYKEVSGPEAEPPEIARRVAAQQASLQAKVAEKVAADPRDAQIAVLIDLVKQLTAQPKKKAGNGDSSSDAADH